MPPPSHPWDRDAEARRIADRAAARRWRELFSPPPVSTVEGNARASAAAMAHRERVKERARERVRLRVPLFHLALQKERGRA